MKNLENLNLQELSIQEKNEISGGFAINLKIFGFRIIGYDFSAKKGNHWQTDLW